MALVPMALVFVMNIVGRGMWPLRKQGEMFKPENRIAIIAFVLKKSGGALSFNVPV
jgi:hypothetical protein